MKTRSQLNNIGAKSNWRASIIDFVFRYVFLFFSMFLLFVLKCDKIILFFEESSFYMDNLNIFLAIAGTLASICGLTIGIVQTVRIKQLKRIRETHVWTSISLLKGIMRNLENEEIQRGHQGTLDLFRLLLSQAVNYEKSISLNTIMIWRKSGRLASTWQENQLRLLINTKTLSNDMLIQDEPKKYFDSIQDKSSNCQ